MHVLSFVGGRNGFVVRFEFFLKMGGCLPVASKRKRMDLQNEVWSKQVYILWRGGERGLWFFWPSEVR